MMSILGRMNPAVCLGGNLSSVHDDTDDVAASSNDDCSKENSNGNTDDGNSGEKKGSMFSTGGGCMSPPTCYSKYHPDDTSEPLPTDVIYQSLNRTVPDLLACISSSPPIPIVANDGTTTASQAAARRKAIREYNAKRTEALQKLHDLTKKEVEHNRVPLCSRSTEQSNNWDVLGVLASALLDSVSETVQAEDDSETNSTIDGSAVSAGSGDANNGNNANNNQSKNKNNSMDENRRLICWTINNLSIPYENKLIIVLGEGGHSAKLLQALTLVIQNNLPETYLCCICLLNLTYSADVIRPITSYVPPSYENGKPPYSSPPRGGGRTRSSSSQNTSGSTGTTTSPTNDNGRPPISPLSKMRFIRSGSANNDKKMALEGVGEGRISEICGLVLGSPSSLMRVVERMMITNAPYLMNTVQSVQGEAIRWACGFIKNVTNASGDDNDEKSIENGNTTSSTAANGNGKSDSLSGISGRQGSIPNESIGEICLLLSQTEIPRLMVQFVRDSPHKTVKWTRDSLEDICLGAMCNLAQWPSSREALQRAGAIECLEKLEALPGIHGYRARAIRCSLGALPMRFG